MSDQDPNTGPDHEWNDPSELAWSEFEWEKYLRVQDGVIARYLECYDKLVGHPERIDETAHQMGWEAEDWSSDPDDDTAGPYTLHQNPVFIATRALFIGLRRDWEQLAARPEEVPPALALAHHAALGRAETQALLAIQSLDLGDYTLTVSLLKRAMFELNALFAQLTGATEPSSTLARHRDRAIPQLFDLREIWLRIIQECREEMTPQVEDEDDEEE